MVDTFFSYEMVTDDDVKFYKAVPGTMKITKIKATDNGVVNIPEAIDGLPVTFYSGMSYFGDPVKKLVIPKTLVTLSSVEDFPPVKDELVIDKDNPEWSTDGASLLSKDGTKLLRMCRKTEISYSIPDGVTTICFNAFKFNNNIEITIPDSVTTVESSAFKFCYMLKNVLGGKKIVNYESSSFSDTEWYKKAPVLILGTTLLRYNSTDENVVIPEGIEVIGPNALSSGHDKDSIMETVVLPSTLKEIGEYAFSGKKNLKAVNFPEGLQTIKKDAFYGCQSLTEIILPDSVAEIGVEAFQGCSSVIKVVIPHIVSGTMSDSFLHKEAENGVISAGAFSGCTSLEHIEIPEGTVVIGDSAFNGCLNLKDIRIPATVKTIGEKAFAYCFNMEELFLPASCVEIGRNAFPHAVRGFAARSANFSRIDVDSQNEAFSSVDGILCSKNGETIVACPSQYNVVDYTVPDGVKEIMPGAFEGCERIRRVVFAKTVEKIGAKAFASMAALEEIVLPPDCPVLGKELFTECENLKHITWPDNVREIGAKCFAYTGIENLDIPETVETVEKYSFSFIKAKRVRLPKTVKDISLSVFAGVPEIEVYDTMDQEAKPAEKHLDDTNGDPNGKVGFIGINQKEGYLVGACNADWYEHTIIVRSAEDDSEKYRVRMPNGQKRKVYCTYASSWGKNAEFNFTAVDNIFKDLTADAKLDYAFNRLHYRVGISEEMLDTLGKYVARNAKDIAARVFKTDNVDDLVMLEPFGIIKKNTVDERIEEALKSKATQCNAWLLNWKNSNLSAKEKAAKKVDSLRVSAPTVAEIKKIWPNKKGVDGGLIITGYNGKDTDVCVPEIIGKTPVTAIGFACFSENNDKNQQEFLRTQLKTVEIPDSVVEIDKMAFWHCEGLEKVKLPSKLRTISRSMFCDCKNLVTEIPENTTEIHDCAFDCCTMKSIRIPAKVRVIEETAFGESCEWGDFGMPDLTTIEVDPASEHFISVDGVLFSADRKTLIKYPQAKAAEKYEIPDGVTRISDNAFAGVAALKSVTVPESVDVIGKNAFSKCSNLENISLPEKVSGFDCTFYGCTALKEVVVPKGVTELPGKCFSGCKFLTRASLPKGLKKIGFQAFMDCENLSEINVPASVRGIGEKAFRGCKTLKDITISRSTTGIGWDVFKECDNLTIHTPAESRMHIYAKTEKIKVEEVIESANEEVITNSKPKKASTKEKRSSCWKLRDGWLESYTGNDREVVIPAKIGSKAVEGLGPSLFEDNKLLEKVVISEGIEQICNNAFRGCTSLSEISFPKSLNYVGNNYSTNGYPCGDTPFHGTPWEKNAGEMILAGTVLVRYFGKEETAEISEGVRVIGELAFVNNKNIKSIQLPSTIEVIQRAAFEGCNQLEEILLPEGITTIEAGAFCGCNQLKEVVLPESLKSFGDDYGGNVFGGCTGMKKLVIKGDNPCVMPNRLFGCDFEIELSRSEPDHQINDKMQDFSSAETGEIVLLGKCSEPVEWIVLKKEEDRALLLAKDSVKSAEYQKFSSKDKPCTWEKSQIRTWLNGPFYSMVFSEDEKQKIMLTANQTQDNTKSGATGGNDTTDKIFLLSEQEVRKFVPKEKRACKCNLHYGIEDCWWTRTPSVSGTQGVVVRSNGSIAQDPASNINMFYPWSAAGIRPACWVKL